VEAASRRFPQSKVGAASPRFAFRNHGPEFANRRPKQAVKRRS